MKINWEARGIGTWWFGEFSTYGDSAPWRQGQESDWTNLQIQSTTSAEGRSRDVVMRKDLWRTLLSNGPTCPIGSSWIECRTGHVFENSMQVKTMRLTEIEREWNEGITTLRAESQIQKPGLMGTSWVERTRLSPRWARKADPPPYQARRTVYSAKEDILRSWHLMEFSPLCFGFTWRT